MHHFTNAVLNTASALLSPDIISDTKARLITVSEFHFTTFSTSRATVRVMIEPVKITAPFNKVLGSNSLAISTAFSIDCLSAFLEKSESLFKTFSAWLI